jgi:hypothetical protein
VVVLDVVLVVTVEVVTVVVATVEVVTVVVATVEVVTVVVGMVDDVVVVVTPGFFKDGTQSSSRRCSKSDVLPN